jgi:hypothetical protein
MIKTRKVLSFDVGIINLAYCLLEINDDEKTFKINRWDIIDLADDRSLCSFFKNSGEQCNKIATRVVKLNKYNNHYYCTAHASKATLKLEPMDIKWQEIEPDEIESCCLCKKSGVYYSNIMGGQYCETHRKTIIKKNKFLCASKKCPNTITNGLYLTKPEIDENGNNVNEVIDMLELGWCDEHCERGPNDLLKKKTKKLSQNSNKISLSYIGASMYQKLDQISDLLMVDEVLVENQPTFINPTMKSVSAMLFSYFIMRGVYEKAISGSTISSVSFCSPGNKLKVGGKKASDKIEDAADDKVYKVTKNLSVKLCKALINGNQKYIEMIESRKKQDDMADAFLQGFIMNFGPVLPDHYAEKIKTVDVKCENKNNDQPDQPDVLIGVKKNKVKSQYTKSHYYKKAKK